MSSDFFKKHFPALSAESCEKLIAYAALLREWNAKVNLVSRKDIDAFEWHHLAPCLFLAEALGEVAHKPYVLWDIGTGGGLPGIPIAILQPHLRCSLIDATHKKIAAVQDMAQRLGLKNVICRAERAEAIREVPDIVVGRGVSAFPEFLKMARFDIRSLKRVYYLTGAPEVPFRLPGWKVTIRALTERLPDPYFEGKILVVAKG